MEANLRPDEIPEGFTAADPNGGGGTSNQGQAVAAKEEQKRSVLEQALTPEAIARLGTIKVRAWFINRSLCSAMG